MFQFSLPGARSLVPTLSLFINFINRTTCILRKQPFAHGP